MRNTKIKTSKARTAFNIVNYIILTLFAIICLLPMLHVLFASFSDPNWLNTKSGLILWPKGFNLEGYRLVFSNAQLIRGYLNTFLYVGASTVLGLLITVIGAYVLSRRDLLWGNTIMLLISFTMLFSGGIVPSYIVMQKLHLLNTRWAVILPSCVSTFNLILMRTGFSAVPKELEESARLDGAGDLVVIFQVLLPLVKATVATVALYYIIGHWNEWFQASMYLQDRELYPLQLVLREILIINDTTSTAAAATSAANATANMDVYKQLVKYCTIIVSSAPIIIVYPFVMKYFESGVMVGSIKG
ncbi:MAG: carbohydrate ABC transporter permease [Eubacteriales bacterium]|nr:carbohydrate ABC transporter permease [Eubacteriales bacterium]